MIMMKADSFTVAIIDRLAAGRATIGFLLVEKLRFF
jgi:hypothetical protein